MEAKNISLDRILPAGIPVEKHRFKPSLASWLCLSRDNILEITYFCLYSGEVTFKNPNLEHMWSSLSGDRILTRAFPTQGIECGDFQWWESTGQVLE